MGDEETDEVYAWRYQAFRALGFDDYTAGMLAESDADVHEAEALKHAGCDLRTLARIVG